MSNHHTADATRLLDLAAGQPAEYGMRYLLEAQVHATLSLSFETANTGEMLTKLAQPAKLIMPDPEHVAAPKPGPSK